MCAGAEDDGSLPVVVGFAVGLATEGRDWRRREPAVLALPLGRDCGCGVLVPEVLGVTPHEWDDAVRCDGQKLRLQASQFMGTTSTLLQPRRKHTSPFSFRRLSSAFLRASPPSMPVHVPDKM